MHLKCMQDYHPTWPVHSSLANCPLRSDCKQAAAEEKAAAQCELQAVQQELAQLQLQHKHEMSHVEVSEGQSCDMAALCKMSRLGHHKPQA